MVAAVVYAIVGLLGWAMFTTTTPTAQRAGDLFALTAILGTPLAAAAVILARRLADAAQGDDLAERIVTLVAGGMKGSDGEWGKAMQAELASIEGLGERNRFALGCALTYLHAGIGRTVWLAALAIGAFMGAAVLITSRVTLAGGRVGVLGIIMFGAIPVLFGAGLLAAVSARSFRLGLVTGGLGMLAALVATMAMSMVEGAHWFQVAGVFVMDGDAPKGGALDVTIAVLDPLRFVVPLLLMWTPWPVLGAAVGDGLKGGTETEAKPAAI